ncbi:hypothetical protein C8J56DRAFT_1166471, partial [Mycena floridula]
MHEALTLDNFAFRIFPSLDAVLSEIPPPQVEQLTIDGLEYPIVQSLPHSHSRDDDRFCVVATYSSFHLLAQSRPRSKIQGRDMRENTTRLVHTFTRGDVRRQVKDTRGRVTDYVTIGRERLGSRCCFPDQMFEDES